MLGQKNDLADVRGIVRQLPVDRLDDGVRLLPNEDGAHCVFRLQRLKRVED
jgi:hypothetical protein